MPADDAPDLAPADPPSTPTDPAQAAEHSPSEPDSPPASDLADAPRPRRRGPDPARRRAASTGFLLGSLAALLVTAVLAVVWYRQMPSEAVEDYILWGVGGGLVLAWALCASVRRIRILAWCVRAVLLAATGIPIALALRRWWEIHCETTVPPRYLPAIAAAFLAGCLFGVCALRPVPAPPRRRRAGRAPGSASRRAVRRSRPAASGRRPRRLLRAAPAPRALAVGAVGFLVPVLVCTGLAVLPSTLVHPAISTTAPAPAAIPARPRAAAGELAWTRLVENPLDVVAGEAGPVVVQAGAVRGLDPATGAVRWSYERPGATLAAVDRAELLGQRYLITSPNGRYAAMRIDASWQWVLTVVLDTRTGEVTAEHPSHEDASLQLTDTAALDGDRAFSLTDGHDLWTLPDPDGERTSLRNARDEGPVSSADLGHTGQAGHSTFVVRAWAAEPRGSWNDLILIPDSDPTATTRIDHVLTDPTDGRFAVVDGWTAQLTEEGARAAEADIAALEEARGKPDADTDAIAQSWQTQAIDIDALAAAPDGDGSAASAAPAQPVPMGVGSGIDRWISLISGELRLLAKGRSGSGAGAAGARSAPAGAVFDPVTRSALAADADPGLASARVGIETAVQSGNTGGSAVVRPGDGSAGIIMPIDDGSLARPSEMLDGGYRPAQQSRVTLESSNVAAMSVPGATLLILTPFDDSGSSHPPSLIRLCAFTGVSS
ncbi:hypothetical protein AM609_13340 [Actinomyces sp. oral taxon 414]|uniref:hypothetical protein n=1 Tax=Actinomyces sp. oral taxon 414 TaxID=712122 RepID=UPI0006AE3423|nr:hypothetical protein [Actinomyces sp. oral taxon 414]ALD00172.1 hypothetical protein AM609_13340 [Actinomyces sp. oral taxon 414]